MQQLQGGPREEQFVYTGGNHRMGRYIECCAEAAQAVMETPEGQRAQSPALQAIGHATGRERVRPYAAVLLDRLDLDRGTLADRAG